MHSNINFLRKVRPVSGTMLYKAPQALAVKKVLSLAKRPSFYSEF